MKEQSADIGMGEEVLSNLKKLIPWVVFYTYTTSPI